MILENIYFKKKRGGGVVDSIKRQYKRDNDLFFDFDFDKKSKKKIFFNFFTQLTCHCAFIVVVVVVYLSIR